MTYEEFVAYTARYGFPHCPLSPERFAEAISLGAHDDDLYGIACDVNAGVDFHVAVKINNRNLER